MRASMTIRLSGHSKPARGKSASIRVDLLLGSGFGRKLTARRIRRAGVRPKRPRPADVRGDDKHICREAAPVASSAP
ncbi:hypothetical protein FBY37_3935 [Streptomyces sp. SLBN-134]|nr:hypothetical protein FBY37_3935 [Streptomyces sp. SLBN-134]